MSNASIVNNCIILESLNISNGTNLTLKSDVDQETYYRCLVCMGDPKLKDALSVNQKISLRVKPRMYVRRSIMYEKAAFSELKLA